MKTKTIINRFKAIFVSLICIMLAATGLTPAAFAGTDDELFCTSRGFTNYNDGYPIYVAGVEISEGIPVDGITYDKQSNTLIFDDVIISAPIYYYKNTLSPKSNLMLDQVIRGFVYSPGNCLVEFRGVNKLQIETDYRPEELSAFDIFCFAGNRIRYMCRKGYLRADVEGYNSPIYVGKLDNHDYSECYATTKNTDDNVYNCKSLSDSIEAVAGRNYVIRNTYNIDPNHIVNGKASNPGNGSNDNVDENDNDGDEDGYGDEDGDGDEDGYGDGDGDGDEDGYGDEDGDEDGYGDGDEDGDEDGNEDEDGDENGSIKNGIGGNNKINIDYSYNGNSTISPSFTFNINSSKDGSSSVNNTYKYYTSPDNSVGEGGNEDYHNKDNSSKISKDYKSTGSSSSSKGGGKASSYPKTGNDTPLPYFLGLLGLSLIGLAGYIARRMRREE